jgi:hypothetical protein
MSFEEESLEEKAKALVNYIRSLPNFEIVSSYNPVYGHMGATITDAILQAGLNFKTVVKPKRDTIWGYLGAQTTSGFLALIKSKSGGGELWEGVAKLLNPWSDQEKPERIVEVAKFFENEGVQTEANLKAWFEKPDNERRLLGLRGIGPKTIDYFKKRAGIPGSAVDRWLRKFLIKIKANIPVSGDSEIKLIIDRAAELMGVDKSALDTSIWRYMSGDC